MIRRALLLLAFSFFLLGALAAQQDDRFDVHVRLYEKTAPAVVYVRGGGRSSSGFFIDRRGVVLTTAAVAEGENVTVQTPSHQRLTARVLGTLPDLEMAVLQVPGEDHPALDLGDSESARIGQVVYTLGDSFGSIQSDDQPAISLGVLSARYELTKQNRRKSYTGPVLETTAAVNPNQDGGPLIDAQGRVLGMITLNYDESKFAGVAVPVQRWKSEVDRILREARGVEVAKEEAVGWFGLEVREIENSVEIVRVSAKGPAEQAGLRVGDRIGMVDEEKVETVARWKELEAESAPGRERRVRVVREGTEKDLPLVTGEKKVY